MCYARSASSDVQASTRNTVSKAESVQEKEEEKLREEFAKQGIKIPIKDKSDVFDSNTITPGTPFMHRLSIALQYYIHCRLNSDPGWKGITVSSLTSSAIC